MRHVWISAATVLVFAHAAFACGTERWAVKTGTDNDVAAVVTTAHLARIGDLIAVQPPARPNARPRNRFAPVETTIFTIQAILTVIKAEDDEDYHLVIADPNDPSQTMIVESPNPSCANGSLFLRMITQTRQAIDQKFGGPIGGRLQPNIPVTVTGIAFFDILHGQEGVACKDRVHRLCNAIELHPLLAIQFN